MRLSSALGSQWSVFDSHAREVFDLGEDLGVDFRLRLAERRRHGAGSYSLWVQPLFIAAASSRSASGCKLRPVLVQFLYRRCAEA